MVLPACAWSRMAPLWQEMLQLQAPKNPALDSSCHHPIPLAFPLPALLPQLNVFWHFPGVGSEESTTTATKTSSTTSSTCSTPWAPPGTAHPLPRDTRLLLLAPRTRCACSAARSICSEESGPRPTAPSSSSSTTSGACRSLLLRGEMMGSWDGELMRRCGDARAGIGDMT
eukprot:726818-Rhodomonas_salina.2